MNERDVERAPARGCRRPTAPAPKSLHRFLRELPEGEAARRRSWLDIASDTLSRIPGLAPTKPFADGLRMAFGVTMAVLIGLAGEVLLVTFRQCPAVPLASVAPETVAPAVTPLRSMNTGPAPIAASLGIMSPSPATGCRSATSAWPSPLKRSLPGTEPIWA